jgi:hypothetical protein
LRLSLTRSHSLGPSCNHERTPPPLPPPCSLARSFKFLIIFLIVSCWEKPPKAAVRGCSGDSVDLGTCGGGHWASAPCRNVPVTVVAVQAPQSPAALLAPASGSGGKGRGTGARGSVHGGENPRIMPDPNTLHRAFAGAQMLVVCPAGGRLRYVAATPHADALCGHVALVLACPKKFSRPTKV